MPLDLYFHAYGWQVAVFWMPDGPSHEDHPDHGHPCWAAEVLGCFDDPNVGDYHEIIGLHASREEAQRAALDWCEWNREDGARPRRYDEGIDDEFTIHNELYVIEAYWFDCSAKVLELAALHPDEQEKIKQRVLEIHAELGVTDHSIGCLRSVEMLPLFRAIY